MKSRRVLQIFVAVLSIVLLACLALLAALLYLGDLIDVIPQQLLDFGDTFKAGMKAVSDKFFLYDEAVPVLVFSVPSVLLLIATILLLVKKGKETKNIVGCIFALLGALTLTAFLMVFAKNLFAESLLIAAFSASGGVLALFVIFVGCALGVRPKRITVTTYATEQTETVEETETQQTSETETASEAEQTEEKEQAVDTLVEEEQQPVEEATESEDDTPATQYVPNLGVTIHDVVEKTYGKEGDTLTKNTIEKINKVRALYDAKAITEEEYIKLMRKYLGF